MYIYFINLGILIFLHFLFNKYNEYKNQNSITATLLAVVPYRIKFIERLLRSNTRYILIGPSAHSNLFSLDKLSSKNNYHQ